jgi:diguanylate cyclase (GGDEF)-like protein
VTRPHTVTGSDEAGNASLVPGLVVFEELGRGAHAAVYRARRNGIDYAVKLLHAPLFADPSAVLAFRREAALLACVNHPGVAAVHEVGQVGDRPYLVMELVRGRTLADVMAVGLIEERVAAIAADVADALGAAHAAGLTHRDVKPQNIMILPDGRAKLIDFGLAARGDVRATDDAVAGTFVYSAPEQTGMLTRLVDGRSDLYSLGVVLFHGLTGRPPFTSSDVGELLRQHTVEQAPDVRSLRPALSANMAAVIAKLLAKDPDDRYQTAAGLAADLTALDTLAVVGAHDGPAGTVETPLVGRSGELATLVNAWSQALAGRGGVAVVAGPPGGGKSRLVRELLGKAAGHLTLHGKCSPDDAVPMGPLRQAVSRYLADVGRLPEPQRTEARATVRRAAGRGASLLGALAPELAEVLEAAGLADEDRQDQFAVSVASFIAELAESAGGGIVYVDDVQWLDAGTRRVLRHLADELSGKRLLVVATSRDDAASQAAYESFVAEFGGTSLVLYPLDDAGMSRILGAHLGGAALTPELTRALVTRSGGNPFTAGEYVRAVIDAGLIRPSWGTWVLEEGGLDALQLPEDVLDLILARVAGLGRENRTLLVAAAAAGMRVSAADLAAICASEDRTVENALRLAADRRLMVAGADGGYTFLHDRIREALLADLDDEARRALHLRIALAMDDLHPHDPEHVFAVARHFELADVCNAPERAYRAAVEAGLLALANHAPQQTLGFLATAELAADAGGIRSDATFEQAFGVACLRAGRYADARVHLQRALASEGEPIRRAMLRGLICESHHSAWEIPQALEAADAALREIGQALPRNRALMIASTVVRFVASFLVAWTGIGRGTATGTERERFRIEVTVLAIASQAAVQARQMVLHTCLSFRELYPANRIGPSPEYVRAHSHLAAAAKMMGAPRASRRLFARVSAVATELADPRLVAYVAWVDAIVDTILRNADIDRAGRMRAVLNEHGRWLDAQEHVNATAALCNQLTHEGHVRESHEQYERTLAKVDHVLPGPSHHYVVVGAAIRAGLGQSEEAARLFEQVRGFLAEHPENREQFCNYVAAAALSIVDQGNLGEEFEALVNQVERAKLNTWNTWLQHHQVFVWWGYGRLAQALREPDAERLAAARRAIRLVRKARTSPLNHGHYAIQRASYAQVSGDPKRALALLERADRRARRVDAPVLHFEIAKVRARALLTLGRADEAALHVQTAMFLAARGGWEHRVRAVSTEFGALTGSLARGSTTGNSISAKVYRQRLDALQEVSLAAATVFEPGELTRVALRETIDIFGAERAFLFLADADTGELAPNLGRDAQGHDLCELTGYGASLVARVHATGTPLVVTGSEEGEVHRSQSAVAFGLRSIMVAPLRLKGRPLGVVYLDSRVAKGIFTGEDVDILMAITNQVAVSMETVRAAQLEVAVQVADRQRDLAEQLRSAMSEVSATLVPDEVLERLLAAVARAARADGAAILRPDGDGAYRVTAATGRAAAGDLVDAGSDAALANLLGDVTPSLGVGRSPTVGLFTGVQSWFSVPLSARGTVHGVLLVGSSEPDAYDEGQLQIAAALAGQGMTAFENARLFDQVTELATIDTMTGIANRRHFLHEAGAAFRETATITAIMLDIDHFKRINDRYGHLVGDAVIAEVGARLRSTLRDGDLVGRYGGEEFAVVVAAEPSHAAELAQRLCAAVAASPVITTAGPVPVTVSVGAARRRSEDSDLGVVLGRADQALYHAKESGRNRVEVA